MSITSAQRLSSRYRIRRLVAASVIGLVTVAGGVTLTAQAHAATYASSVNECLVFRPYLSRGVADQDQCVAALQTFLRFHYGNGVVDVDGRFGKQTREATINFQRAAGIKMDGEVGPDTWRHIAISCSAQRDDCDYKYPYPLP
ncbi:peptidoglycan-binding domain-containing protein [Nocardia bovistercoris]|uniref:Peptidoglycan-binding protein n=1 Tax=Nocardia bovistercoris TaxID=2785916 RepID=A0A931IIC5_9NOCA|nr:peptidoglycan-binding domain-containing protein [Nocardia bovistercoris]MBH0780900.1 peptidoglycan-binding protein [Nocardia bovistercoris]